MTLLDTTITFSTALHFQTDEMAEVMKCSME